MTTADWALIISIISALTALASFCWNVWSKFIYPKPRVRVGFGFMNIVDEHQTHQPILSLSATNFGPASVTLFATVLCKKAPLWKRVLFRTLFAKTATLNPIISVDDRRTNGPFTGLPKTIQVGEQFSAHFVADHEGIENTTCDLIGFTDTFQQFHWASKKDLTTVIGHIKEYRKKIHGPHMADSPAVTQK